MNRDDAIADIAFLERALEERFSYLKTNGVDHAALFAELREKLPVQGSPPGSACSCRSCWRTS